jgi:hypothetical protein
MDSVDPRQAKPTSLPARPSLLLLKFFQNLCVKLKIP